MNFSTTEINNLETVRFYLTSRILRGDADVTKTELGRICKFFGTTKKRYYEWVETVIKQRDER